jgi:4-hydroxybenzoate polyprenyltransferase
VRTGRLDLRAALALGRISNLPTVWSNGLAGVLLAGGSLSDPVLLAVLLALSAFYVAGMYLNDAFDAPIDARERPKRPIPSGAVTPETVWFGGILLLLVGLALLLVAAASGGRDPTAAVAFGLGLGFAILLYDFHHKQAPWSPLVMGACRGLAYLTAAACIAPWPQPVLWLAAFAGFAHVVGLSYVARHEQLARMEAAWPLALFALSPLLGFWFALAHPLGLLSFAGLVAASGYSLRLFARRHPGDVPQAVVVLIAGICLLDGCLLARAGWPALFGPAGFVLTLALQRLVRGT